MAPKSYNSVASRGSGRPGHQPSFLQSAYRELTAAENQSVIRSVALFGVSSRYANQMHLDLVFNIGANFTYRLLLPSSLVVGAIFFYHREYILISTNSSGIGLIVVQRLNIRLGARF
jgi:hypothetical protein